MRIAGRGSEVGRPRPAGGALHTAIGGYVGYMTRQTRLCWHMCGAVLIAGCSLGSCAGPTAGRDASEPAATPAEAAQEPALPRRKPPIKTDTAAACVYGADHTCNENPADPALLGVCQRDGNCVCRDGATESPATGRCF
jgi:hypothetical protein